MSTDRDHYRVLGIPETASARDVTRAYRRLVRELHPDAGGGDPRRLQETIEAYRVLGDPDRRRAYDDARAGRAGRARARATRSSGTTGRTTIPVRHVTRAAPPGPSSSTPSGPSGASGRGAPSRPRVGRTEPVGRSSRPDPDCPTCGGTGTTTRRSGGGITIRGRCPTCRS
ncbi:MAG TPA: J domain-containing protein [Acidimicrobiales bacterium]